MAIQKRMVGIWPYCRAFLFAFSAGFVAAVTAVSAGMAWEAVGAQFTIAFGGALWSALGLPSRKEIRRRKAAKTE